MANDDPVERSGKRDWASVGSVINGLFVTGGDWKALLYMKPICEKSWKQAGCGGGGGGRGIHHVTSLVVAKTWVM